MFTVRNAVLIALMQIGVIVTGVLAAGVCNKWWTSTGAIGLPLPTLFLINYGVVALSIPMLWIVAVLQLRRRPEVSDDAKDLAFLSGIILLLVFCIFVGYAVLSPWLQVDWGMG